MKDKDKTKAELTKRLKTLREERGGKVLNKITKRKQTEEELKESLQYTRGLIETSLDSLVTISAEGKITDLNTAFELATGMSRKEIIGTDFLNYFTVPDTARKSYQQAFRDSYVKNCLLEIKHRDGRVTPTICNGTVYKDRQGRVAGVFAAARDITERKQAEERIEKTIDTTIEAVSKITETKDSYIAGHQRRVSQLAVSLARELSLAEEKIEGIRIASLIHDIGKVGIPIEILSKPGRLTDIEFNLIKGHSQMGYDILKPIDFPYPIANIVLQHHERLNGSGYPQGLKADEILLEAKIIGVADVVEAMSSYRPYRPALGIDAALEEISKNKGILYDPEIVDACLKLFKEKEFKF